VKKFYRDHFEQRKTTSYFEFPIRTKHGEILWVGQHVTTLFKQGLKKHVNGFLALARDITLKREQEQIIREQRDDITSSITYAKRIQDNLLPNEVSFGSSFEEYFLLYEPKDIVSGDFYWMHRIDGCTIVALGDCTGHGVPGAFMTLLGINILNSTVLENRIIEPSQILNEMDKKLTNALHGQIGNEDITDGMEITICVFDHHAGTLSFACAGSRFLIFENGAFNMYKGDIKHVGDNDLKDFNGYITHSLPFNEESILYLFTDGFQDQFGGTKNKKFSFRRLLELFESNIRLPLKEQKPMIQDEFIYWKQLFEQTDDVTIIALKKLKN
jgi:serine phosphatase RsbU (regulator of sigma subunit)